MVDHVRAASAGRSIPTSALGWTVDRHRDVFARHVAEEFVDILTTKAAVATEGYQARDEALGRPSTDGLRRHVQHRSDLARCQVLAFMSISHDVPDQSSDPPRLEESVL